MKYRIILFCMLAIQSDAASNCYQSPVIGSSFMLQCMKEHGIERYYPYFNEISRLPQMSDELKITRELVMIPFFVALSAKAKEKQYEVLADFAQERFVLNYSLWRLFLAALSYAGVPDEGYILCTAIYNKDTSLVQQSIKNGADVNSYKCGYSSLWWCTRAQEAQVLVDHGVSVAEHHNKNDLIEPICNAADFFYDRDGVALMEFYLQSGVRLNERNNFGQRWFNILFKKLDVLDPTRCAVEQKIRLLWQAGRYSNRGVDALNIFLLQKSCYPIARKLLTSGIFYRLHERSLIGRDIMKVKPVAMKSLRKKALTI